MSVDSNNLYNALNLNKSTGFVYDLGSSYRVRLYGRAIQPSLSNWNNKPVIYVIGGNPPIQDSEPRYSLTPLI